MQARSGKHRVWMLLCLSWFFGCAWRTKLPVTRPAALNAAAVGNTYSIGEIQTDIGWVAQQIRADLSQRFINSLNPSIRLLSQGGGVVVDAIVHTQTADEQFTEESRTCTKTVPVGDRYQSVSYTCVTMWRTTRIVARIEFRVRLASTGQLVFDRLYERRDKQETVGNRSEYGRQDPAPIPAGPILSQLDADIVQEFARVVLPWQESVEVTFEPCDGAPQCRVGYDLAKRHDLEGAERAFTLALGEYETETSVPNALANRVAQALYNRGVVRGFLSRYADAASDLARAIALRPDNQRWIEALSSLQSLAQNESALRAQGAVSAEQLDVRAAGTP